LLTEKNIHETASRRDISAWDALAGVMANANIELARRKVRPQQDDSGDYGEE
jgi:hypothetical protein